MRATTQGRPYNEAALCVLSNFDLSVGLKSKPKLLRHPERQKHHSVMFRSRTSKNVQRIARFCEQNAIAFWGLAGKDSALRDPASP